MSILKERRWRIGGEVITWMPKDGGIVNYISLVFAVDGLLLIVAGTMGIGCA